MLRAKNDKNVRKWRLLEGMLTMLRKVTTENGIVKGLPGTNARITVFKGIPFAAPPVGDLRWKAPQPAKNWEGELEAYKFKNISVQDTPGVEEGLYDKEWHVDNQISMGEDCLYLNVWSPAHSKDDKLPVLVWFFGGGFQWGYPCEMEFDGEHLAKQGIIVVTVNYRLGAIGFLAHPEITKENPDAPANFGSLDQQAGLKWVYRNIKNFGGDPENISIAGQSAGGGSTLLQLTCEENYKMIKSATIMSGMIRNPYAKDDFIVPQDISLQEKRGEKFFEFLGVKSLSEARKLDAFFIRDKYAEFRNTYGMFSPCIDHKFCVGEPYGRMLNGNWAKVPLLSGNTSDEFKSFIPSKDEAELKDKVKEIFGDKADKFLSFPETLEKGPMGYATVSGIEASVKGAAEKNPGENIYYYRFDPDIPGDNAGTFHSVDLWFFFNNIDKCWRPFEGRHYDIARQMSNYWLNLIKTGNPNGEDINGKPLPTWTPYAQDKCEMVFTRDGAVTKKDNSEFLSFIKDTIVSKAI